MKVLVDSLARRPTLNYAFSTTKSIALMTDITILKGKEIGNRKKNYRMTKSNTLLSNISRYFFA
jgi:hypothetical protein